MMHYILFEIFHHEFFHHIAESMATTLEMISATMGKSQPIYLDYSKRQYTRKKNHPHAPLEEALANAYAYNSFSFVNRVGSGCMTGGIKSFQAAIQRYWKSEPAGYCDAHGKISHAQWFQRFCFQTVYPYLPGWFQGEYRIVLSACPNTQRNI